MLATLLMFERFLFCPATANGNPVSRRFSAERPAKRGLGRAKNFTRIFADSPA
jgi:hypothetical protein